MQQQQTTSLVPNVQWVACGQALPDEDKLVWVVVGRVIESGFARRYERQVHMGVYRGNLRFQIHAFGPTISDQVWGWATITPPERPACKNKSAEEQQYDNGSPESDDEYFEDFEDYPEED